MARTLIDEIKDMNGVNVIDLTRNKFSKRNNIAEINEQAEHDTLYDVLLSYGIAFGYIEGNKIHYPDDDWHDMT